MLDLAQVQNSEVLNFSLGLKATRWQFQHDVWLLYSVILGVCLFCYSDFMSHVSYQENRLDGLQNSTPCP